MACVMMDLPIPLPWQTGSTATQWMSPMTGSRLRSALHHAVMLAISSPSGPTTNQLLSGMRSSLPPKSFSNVFMVTPPKDSLAAFWTSTHVCASPPPNGRKAWPSASGKSGISFM